MKNIILILSLTFAGVISSDFSISCVSLTLIEFLCTDEGSLGNETLSKVCADDLNPFIKIELNHKTELTKSDFNRCSAEELSIVDGSLSRISSGTFQDFIHLSYLNLSNNNLISFDLSSLPDFPLLFLDLSHNGIVEVHSTAENPSIIQEFILSYNAIDNLARINFPYWRDLQILNLSHNNIEWIPFNSISRLHNLNELDLSYNKLHNLPFGVFNQLDLLTHLDLSNNQLLSKDLETVYGLKNLLSFYFHNNQIDQLEFKLLPSSVKIVSVHGNKFNLSCEKLARMIHGSKLEIPLIADAYPDKENVHGIPCYRNPSGDDEKEYLENQKQSCNNSLTINPIQFVVLIMILILIAILLTVNTFRNSFNGIWFKKKRSLGSNNIGLDFSAQQELLET